MLAHRYPEQVKAASQPGSQVWQCTKVSHTVLGTKSSWSATEAWYVERPGETIG